MNADQLIGAFASLGIVAFGIWWTGHDATLSNVLGIGLGYGIGAIIVQVINRAQAAYRAKKQRELRL